MFWRLKVGTACSNSYYRLRECGSWLPCGGSWLCEQETQNLRTRSVYTQHPARADQVINAWICFLRISQLLSHLRSSLGVVLLSACTQYPQGG